MEKVLRFVIETNDTEGGKSFVVFWPTATPNKNQLAEPAFTSFIELAHSEGSYFDIKLFEAFVKGTKSFVNDHKLVIKAYLLANQSYSVNELLRRGVKEYEEVTDFSTALTVEQHIAIKNKYKETVSKYGRDKESSLG